MGFPATKSGDLLLMRSLLDRLFGGEENGKEHLKARVAKKVCLIMSRGRFSRIQSLRKMELHVALESQHICPSMIWTLVLQGNFQVCKPSVE